MATTLFLVALKSGTLAFATLFPIVNHFGAVPIFLGLTQGYPESTRKLLARRVAIYGFLLFGWQPGNRIVGPGVFWHFTPNCSGRGWFSNCTYRRADVAAITQ